ncbi:hypothetical protein Tco_0744837 [Tanacetum coccineum]
MLIPANDLGLPYNLLLSTDEYTCSTDDSNEKYSVFEVNYNGVFIKLPLSLLDAVRITAAHVCFNAAQLKLVLLVNISAADELQRKYAKKLLLLVNYKLMLLLKEFDLLKWDQQVVTELVEKLVDMDQDSAHMVAASKVLMLKPDAKQVHGKAVNKTIGGNVATRKTQRNLLKQQYENFTVTPPNRVPSDLASRGVTSMAISSTKHKERPLRVSNQRPPNQF